MNAIQTLMPLSKMFLIRLAMNVLCMCWRNVKKVRIKSAFEIKIFRFYQYNNIKQLKIILAYYFRSCSEKRC